jgi:hypothetical protein
MIHPDELARAIEMTGSRYAVCILLAKRAKQLHWHRRRTDVGLGALARQALDDIVYRRIEYFLPASATPDMQRQLWEEPLTPRLLAEKEAELTDYALLSLYALAKANLENDGSVLVGNDYSVQAGVSSSPEKSFQSQPFDIEVSHRLEKIPFDFLIHLVGKLKLVGDCQHRLYYDPLNPDLQLAEFKFKVLDEGPNLVSVDCYHDRRWLRTFEFTFDAVEIDMKAVA